MLYYESLVGSRYAKGGRGPDGYDCYGLLIELFRREGIEIPDYASPEDRDAIALLMAKEKGKWREVWGRGNPTPFDLRKVEPHHVLLISIQGIPFHVGMCVARNKFIHVWEKCGGAIVEPITRWQHRIVGVYAFDGFNADHRNSGISS